LNKISKLKIIYSRKIDPKEIIMFKKKVKIPFRIKKFIPGNPETYFTKESLEYFSTKIGCIEMVQEAIAPYVILNEA